MISISLPMVISHGCDTVMIFTDRLFLSKLGPEQMNAAMGGGLTVFMLTSFLVGLISYVTALTAQYLGAGRKESSALVLTQALILSVAAYPLVLLGRPLGPALFELIGVPVEQLAPQKIYFDILLFGSIVSLWRIGLSSFFSGIGRTGIVMLASAIAMIVNVFVNYILVFGELGFPAMGIRGTAIGTIVGGMSGVVVLAAAYLSPRIRREFDVRNSWRFDRILFAKLIHFGSPTGVEMCLNILAFNGVVMLFHSHGLVTATAATIVFNWDLVSFVPLIGVEVGVTSLVGRAMGSGDWQTAHRSVMAGIKVGVFYSAFVLLLFVGFPEYLVEVFRPSGAAEVFLAAVPLAVDMVRVASLYVLVEAMFIVLIGALRGAGDTHWAMITSVSLHWMMAGVLFLLLRVFGCSPLTGWTAVVVLFLVFSFVVLHRYREGHWKTIQVVEPRAVEPAAPVVSDRFHETGEI